jgi:DNA-binding NarL/FixJ family response regulator
MWRPKLVRMTKPIVDLKSASGGIIVDLVEKDNIHVLHVDDDPVFLNTAKQCLEAQGKFHVDTALSVEDAQEKMNGKTYDVIICESVMPRKQGLEFLKELRDSGSNIAFIIVTGRGTEDLAVKALNLGADRYFSKVGCSETACDELAHGICQVVEGKKAEETLRQSENYLKTMLDSVFTGLVVIDEKTHNTFLKLALPFLNTPCQAIARARILSSNPKIARFKSWSRKSFFRNLAGK